MDGAVAARSCVGAGLLRASPSMTLAATWCSYEPPAPPRLWMASDSRISDNHAPLIDQGIKLYEVPIVCRAPGPSGFFDGIFFEGAVGLLGAGGSLVFQHVYGTVVPLLGNLLQPAEVAPTLAEVAHFVGRVTTIYVRSLGWRRSDAARVTIIVGGESSSGPEAYELAPRLSEQGLVEFVPSAITLGDGVAHFIGDRTAEAQATYMELTARDEPGASRQRAALTVIRRFIDDEQVKSIGGDLQIGYSAGGRFRRVASVTPDTQEPSAPARYQLNSIDLDELGPMVGHCRVGIDAVAVI